MCEVEQREVVTLGDVVQGRRQVPARVQGHPGHDTRDTRHVTRGPLRVDNMMVTRLTQA